MALDLGNSLGHQQSSWDWVLLRRLRPLNRISDVLSFKGKNSHQQVLVPNCPSFIISCAFSFFTALILVSWVKISLLFFEVSGMRATVNSSFLSTCELSCCEEHELPSEKCWKHLPAWVVYVRKSWDEIQRIHVRSLKIMFCGGEVAHRHPSPSCIFILQPPSLCSQWRNLSGVLTPIFFLSTL